MEYQPGKYMLGEEGTEQFTVETRVDGKTINVQPIHDPFIHNTIVVGLTRLDHFCAIFRKRQIRVEVTVRSSEGAQRAIMILDPMQLSRDTEEILVLRRISYETTSTTGQCAEVLQRSQESSTSGNDQSKPASQTSGRVANAGKGGEKGE